MKRKIKIVSLAIAGFLLLCAIYFFTVRYLDRQVLARGFASPAGVSTGDDAKLLPSEFVDRARFYLLMPTSSGHPAHCFCDTGGGLSFLLPHAKNRAEYGNAVRSGVLKGLMKMEYLLADDIVPDATFPRAQLSPNLVLRTPFSRVTQPYFLVPPMDGEMKFMMEVHPKMDLFLGQDFFVNRSWTFDYLNQRVWLNTPLDLAQKDAAGVLPIGFKKNEDGNKTHGHPSMSIQVDGEVIDVLFDTGATMILTAEGKQQLQTDKKSLGGSFIASSVMEYWRSKYPEWKFYPKADQLGDIIEVPLVKIAGYEAGPVLFASRPDRNWSKDMIASMDKVVKGALGGSAMQYFKVTIDYNSELVKFER
jgi:hypothetical protein